MRILAAAALFVLLATRGCERYEFDHELWLSADGSGHVRVTGRPELWHAFKGLPSSPHEEALRASARALFERSGLRVRRVSVTHRAGHAYLFVAADFEDANRLRETEAFSDLDLRLSREPGRLRLSGVWRPPPSSGASGDGMVAIRFHVPSKIYEHKNASSGVERGNIVSWREATAEALAGRALEVGLLMDERSILHSTVGLFVLAVFAALGLLGGILLAVSRRGRAPAQRRI